LQLTASTPIAVDYFSIPDRTDLFQAGEYEDYQKSSNLYAHAHYQGPGRGLNPLRTQETGYPRAIAPGHTAHCLQGQMSAARTFRIHEFRSPRMNSFGTFAGTLNLARNIQDRQ